MKALIERAVEIHGSVAAFARAIGVQPPTVHQWLAGTRPVPPTRCLLIEAATDGEITRYKLRSDVFGPAPDQREAA